MSNIRSVRARLLAAGAAAVLVVSTVVALAAPAAADTVPPVTTPATPATVSADALPTVQIDGVVWAQVTVGNTVYAAGSFATARPAGSAPKVNTTIRNNLLAYNITTGALISTFAPNLNGQALAIAASPDGKKLYFGGDFTQVDAKGRSRIAAYDLINNKLVDNFKPAASTTVRAIVATNSTVYFGGDFTTVGVARNRLAAVDVATGNLLDWNPNADAPVTAMTMTTDGSKIVVGGRFANIGGNAWYGLAALDPTTGLTVPWAATTSVRDAGVNASITSLTATSDGVYGSGYVYGAGGNLEGVFRADPVTGNIIWIEDCHGDTYSVYAGNPDLVYVASHEHYCGNIGGFPQTPLPWATYRGTAFTKAVTGTITADPLGYHNWAGTPSPSLLNWFPTFATGSYTGQGQAGWSVTGNSQYIAYGGEFPSVNGRNQQGLVRFAVSSLAPNTVGPDSNDGLTPTVQALSPGAVRVSWMSTFDRDNVAITYRVYRNFQSLSDTPIYTTTVSNTFWQRRTLGFFDTTAAVGQTYNYRVYAVDPFGNSVSRGATTITVPPGSASGSQTYPNAVEADSPNTYWRLGDPSATSTSDYVGFNDGITAAGVTQSTDGIVAGDANTASTFDGKADGVISTQLAAPAPNNFSVEAWFKTGSTSGGKIIGYGSAATANSSTYDRQIYLDNSGKIYFGVNQGGVQTLNSTAGLNDDQWHQVVGTLGPSGMQLFIDGRRVAARGDVTTGASYSGYWRVGGDNLAGWPSVPTSNYLAGAIDEVAIYSSALTSSQVDDHYVASGRAPQLAPRPTDPYGGAVYDLGPDLFWRLDEGVGAAIAADSGPTGNAAAIGSGVTLGAAGALTGQSTTAGRFNGTAGGAAVEQNAEQGTNVYSEGVWFKTTTTVGGKLIGFGASPSPSGTSTAYDRHLYMSNNGQIVFGAYTTVRNVATSPSTYNDGQWHFAMATQGSGGMVLYLDGQPIATNPQTNAQAYTGYWRLGGDTTWGSSSPWFAGTLDEATVFPTTLTAGQVSALYAAGTAGTANPPPVAAFTSSSSGLTAAFDGTGSTDANGIASYAWNFGDGSSGTGATPNHTYASGRAYTVTLTVTDNLGATTAVSHSVTVTAPPPVNHPPVAAFTLTSANLSVSVNGSTSTDPDGDTLSYAWTFGDGGTATGVTAGHTYPTAGSYSVVLTVTDTGSLSNSISKSVTVTAPPAGPVPFAQDSFGRTVATGLGTADLGGAWTVSGAAAQYAVNGSAAQFAMTAPAATPTAALASVSSTTTDVRVDISTDKALTGGGAYLTLVGRRISSTSDYRTYLKINAAGQVTLVVSKRVSGTETVLSTKVVPGLTYTAGSPVTLRLQVSGTNSVLLNARVWKTGTTEPTTWQSSVTDATAALAGPGGLGLQTYLSSSATNAPVVATFDNLVAQPVN